MSITQAVAHEHLETNPWYNNWMVGFDLETTAASPHEARVVTAAIVMVDPAGTVHDSKTWLVNPGVDIPDEAADIHGITTEYAQQHGADLTQSVGEIAFTLNGFMDQGVPIVAYNAVYDFTVLAKSLHELGQPALTPRHIIDPFVIDKHVEKYRKGKRTLSVTSDYYGVQLADAHDALADAVAAVQVAQAIAAKHQTAVNESLLQIFTTQQQWKAEQSASFEQYLRRSRDPEAVIPRSWPVKPF